MKTPARSSALAAGVAAGSLVAFAASGGNLLVGLLPLAVFLFVLALARAPLHHIGYALLFLGIALDDPRGNPATARWKNPLYPLSAALFDNLNNVTGVDSLRFALVEVLIAVTLIALLARAAGDVRTRVPRPLALATTAATACVLALEVYGMGRGGDFRASLWQIRQLFWVGPIAWIFFLSLRGAPDLAPLARVVLGAAVVKAAEALWFYFVECRPLGIRPAFVNTHADTVLYVTAVMILLAGLLEKRTPRALAVSAALLPLFGLAIVLNNRRIAFVSIAASLALAYLLFPPSPAKARLRWMSLAAAPFVAIYLAIGWTSSSAIFLPAAKVASLFSKEDHSAAGRDIENWDLVQTYKAHPIFGSGFGHEYFEIQKADPIKDIFPLYRFVAHNSVLWQWTLGGLVGFTLLWMPLVLTAYFAMRAYRTSALPAARAAALVCASVVVAQEIQHYGDMGSQAWLGAFLLGAASAMAGKLAIASGGWRVPAPAPAKPLRDVALSAPPAGG